MNSFTEQESPGAHASDVLVHLVNAVESLRENKPDERSELARIYAVAITQAEMVLAYFGKYAADALIERPEM